MARSIEEVKKAINDLQVLQEKLRVILSKELSEAYKLAESKLTKSPFGHDMQQYTETCLFCHKNVWEPLVDPYVCYVEDIPEWARNCKNKEELQAAAQVNYEAKYGNKKY